MGGRGSGGRRVGAGRRPKPPGVHLVDGTESRSNVLAHPSAAAATVERFDPPANLDDPAARGVWDELAPHAFEAGTLTPATSAAFAMLCRAVVRERALSKTKACGGTNHRGLMQRVATSMKDFAIAPLGKPLGHAAAPPASKLDRFTNRVRS
jgi:hypothetical protein